MLSSWLMSFPYESYIRCYAKKDSLDFTNGIDTVAL